MRTDLVALLFVIGGCSSPTVVVDAGNDGGVTARDAQMNDDAGSDARSDACAICAQACGGGLPSCDDGELCNGTETCGGVACSPGTAAPDGTVCLTTGKGASCIAGRCVPNP